MPHEEHLFLKTTPKQKNFSAPSPGCAIVMVSSESSSGSLLEAAAQYTAVHMK